MDFHGHQQICEHVCGGLGRETQAIARHLGSGKDFHGQGEFEVEVRSAVVGEEPRIARDCDRWHTKDLCSKEKEFLLLYWSDVMRRPPCLSALTRGRNDELSPQPSSENGKAPCASPSTGRASSPEPSQASGRGRGARGVPDVVPGLRAPRQSLRPPSW